MDNLSITSFTLEGMGEWTGTPQLCINQAQYDLLGMQIAVGVGFAFLVGWFLGYYVKDLGRKNK